MTIILIAGVLVVAGLGAFALETLYCAFEDAQ